MAQDSAPPPESVSPASEHESPAASPRRRAVPLWLALAGMVIGLLLATVILARVAGPLYGLLFPVEVPVPDGVEQIDHQDPDQGAEYWIYRTTRPGREIAAFYEDEGGECWYTARDEALDPVAPGMSYSVAHCLGTKISGGLGVGWEVYIHEGYSPQQGPTIFRLYRYGEVD